MTLREKVARYAHDVWCRWAGTILNEEVLTDDRLVRWKRLVYAKFDDLTEREKIPDYAEADRILALVAEDRRELVEALEEAKSALKIALPAVDEHGLNMDRHIVRKAIVGCDAAIDAALAKGGKG